jgi:hypothetical protein
MTVPFRGIKEALQEMEDDTFYIDVEHLVEVNLWVYSD